MNVVMSEAECHECAICHLYRNHQPDPGGARMFCLGLMLNDETIRDKLYSQSSVLSRAHT